MFPPRLRDSVVMLLLLEISDSSLSRVFEYLEPSQWAAKGACSYMRVPGDLAGSLFSRDVAWINHDAMFAPDCLRLLIMVSNFSNYPFLSFRVKPNPSNKIILATTRRNITSLMEELSVLRRSRLLIMTTDGHNDTFYTFKDMSELTEIPKKEVDNFFKEEPMDKVKDFHGRKLVVTTFNCTIYSQVGSIRGSDGQPEWVDGYETLTLLELSKILNLSVEFKITKGEVKWGVLLVNGSWTEGIIKYAIDWEADVAICGIWPKPTQIGLAEMSNPWNSQCHRYIVPRPKLETSNWAVLFSVFPIMIWVLVLASEVVMTFSLWFLANVERNPFNEKYRALLRSGQQVLAMLLQADFPDQSSNRGLLASYLFSIWVWFCFLISTAFSSNLAALLTYPEYTQKIDTIDGFIKAKYFWGKPSEEYADLIFDLKDPVQRKWRYKHFSLEKSPMDRIIRIRTGKYVIDGESVDKVFFFSEPGVPQELIVNYEAASKCQYKYYTGYMFPLGSPVVKQINLVISRLRAGGLLQKFQIDTQTNSKNLFKFIAKDVFKFTKDFKESRTEVLNMTSLKSPFILLLFGLSLASLIFVGELLAALFKNERHFLTK